jgi:hypothetical protein
LTVETIKGKGTKEPDASGPYITSLPQSITSAVRKFTNLAESEKQALTGNLNSLDAKGVNMKRFASIFLNLRPEESKIAVQLVEKQLVSLQPVQLKTTAVHQPLMSGYTAGKEDLEIFLPDSLEPYADHGLVLELLRYVGSVDRVKITRCAGTIKAPNESRLSGFIMGYITELLSDQKIAKIQYSKSSYYQLGRMTARAKLLQLVANDLQIPQKYLVVPSRFYGGTSEFKEPESSRTLRSLVADEIDLIDTLLRNLSAHVYRTQPEQVKAKLDASLFMPFAEFVHVHERRAKKESKNKKGKTSTSYSTIKATKPSTLATVAPWEREAVAEIYDTSWTDLHTLEEEFRKTPPLQVNYNDASNKLTRIIERQWSDKQLVLRRTKQRLTLSHSPNEVTQWKKLNEVRTILSEFKRIEVVPMELLRLLDPHQLIPVGNVTLPDGFTTSYSNAFDGGLLHDKYPNMTAAVTRFRYHLSSLQGETPE